MRSLVPAAVRTGTQAIFTAALMLAGLPGSAYGASIGVSPATYSGSLLHSTSSGQQFLTPNQPGTYTLPEETLSMLGTPQATLEGTASSTAPGGGVGGTGSHGGGNLSYYFMYLGASNTNIPIIIDALLDISLAGTPFYTGNANAGLVLTSNATGDIVNQSIDCNLYLGCTQANFHAPIHANIVSNTEYEVRLHIGWQAENGNSAHVLADPMISIDPTFAGDPSQFQLIQSADVGNGGAAPEPATLGLTAAAGAAALFFRRRQRSGGGHPRNA